MHQFFQFDYCRYMRYVDMHHILGFVVPQIELVLAFCRLCTFLFFRPFKYKCKGKIKTRKKSKRVLRCMVLLTIFVLAKHANNTETTTALTHVRLCQKNEFFTTESIKTCENLSMKILACNINMTQSRLLSLKSNKSFFLHYYCFSVGMWK